MHNTHHAATNVIDHDGDIDIMPLLALIPSDLQRFQTASGKIYSQGSSKSKVQIIQSLCGNKCNETNGMQELLVSAE
ncbi:hypothetical protein KIN20_021192 [Parelaphostrongylus tenuis]|uniref:Uncharacterized protein n=1 Tax=Parelaphostrongylus tenuis TaxID=148309 RepID=A0AAD5N4Y8_PARTN|nr:hypothetical protein KIN20_021192 [Parelaphostrongylus tenuis]